MLLLDYTPLARPDAGTSVSAANKPVSADGVSVPSLAFKSSPYIAKYVGRSVRRRDETYAEWLITSEIKQMMFVAGETSEPSIETTTLIEQIVHEQVYEMVS